MIDGLLHKLFKNDCGQYMKGPWIRSLGMGTGKGTESLEAPNALISLLVQLPLSLKKREVQTIDSSNSDNAKGCHSK
jgi:hypothetical protein